MRRIFSTIMRAGKAVTFCLGLALVLALTAGVASTALAAVPGSPLKLGEVNAVNALTRLAGNVAGPMLVVDNNSGAAIGAGSTSEFSAPRTVADSWHVVKREG